MPTSGGSSTSSFGWRVAQHRSATYRRNWGTGALSIPAPSRPGSEYREPDDRDCLPAAPPARYPERSGVCRSPGQWFGQPLGVLGEQERLIADTADLDTKTFLGGRSHGGAHGDNDGVHVLALNGMDGGRIVVLDAASGEALGRNTGA